MAKWPLILIIICFLGDKALAEPPLPKPRPTSLAGTLSAITVKPFFPKPNPLGQARALKGKLKHGKSSVLGAKPKSLSPYRALVPWLKSADAEMFKTALNHLDADEFLTFFIIFSDIKDPLMRDILIWQGARKESSPFDAEVLKQFLDRRPNWPSRKRIYATYEKKLAGNLERFLVKSDGFNGQEARQKKEIEAIIAIDAPKTTALKLAQAMAFMQQGQPQKAKTLIQALWQHQTLDEEAEKTLLSYFSALLTEADHKARYALLLTRHNKAALARLEPYLGALERANYQALDKPDNLLSLYADQGVLALSSFHLYTLLNTMKKSKPDRAAIIFTQAFMAAHPALVSPSRKWQGLRRRIAHALVAKDYNSAAFTLLSKTLTNTCDAAALMQGVQIALNRLREKHKASLLLDRIVTICDQAASKAMGFYWRGLLARQAGDTAKAKSQMNEAARFPFTFYGQLALDDLGRPISFFTETPELLPEFLPQIKASAWLQDERFKAGAWLFQAERDYLSVLFFMRMAFDNTEARRSKTLLGWLDIIQDHYARYIVATIVATKKHVDKAYHFLTTSVPEAAADAVIERPYQLAVARQESQFNRHAKSGAGALGLMQLLPTTAAPLAKSMGLEADEISLTRDEGLNVTLGSAYLFKLKKRFKGSMVLALSGYNAGPTRTAEWLDIYGDPRQNSIDWITWIETIPYRETRQYIKKVIASATVYRWIMGGRKPIQPNIHKAFMP